MSATPADDDLIGSIQGQLEGLRKTPDGLFLYRLIDRGLQKRSGNYTGDTGVDFVNFLHGLLQRYASNPGGDTVTRVKVRLLQQRLAPHMMREASSVEESPGEAEGQAGAFSGSADAIGAAETGIKGDAGNAESASADTSTTNMDFADTGSSEKTGATGSAADPETRSPDSLELDGLALDESAFDVSDESLQEIEFLDHDDDGIDFFGVDDQASSDPPSAEAGEDSAGVGDAQGSIHPPADTHSAGIDLENPGSRHEIEIDIGDELSISPPVDIANDDEGDSIDARSPVFETVEEPEEEPEPLDFGDEFSLDFPESDPDIIVGEVVDARAAEGQKPEPDDRRKTLAVHPASGTDSMKDSSRERVDRLHETFASKLAESISRNKDYTTLLRSNLKALELAHSPDDVLDIKHLLVHGLEDLLQGNETLNRDLGATNHYLKISQLDRNLLKDELGRVRDQSLVDELTGLQNRRAFDRQISAEIGRSKRYGFSLALALIVLDGFDHLKETQGNEAGNEILRTFAHQILTGFRGYDAVARLSNHQFGILFPNTQKEGALSALEKAQKRAADTVIQCNGKSLRLPTFTSSLTLYSPGDLPEAILKRIYDALALADENTRDKIIVALPQT